MALLKTQKILKRVIENVCRMKIPDNYCIPVWGVVARLTNRGSTSAIELCRELEIDPHRVLPARCLDCGAEHGAHVIERCPECGYEGVTVA